MLEERQLSIDVIEGVEVAPPVEKRPRGECLLPLRRLRRDGGTQLRQQMSAEATMEYAEALERGESFPPVVAFDDGEDIWLADGFHRYDAHAIQERGEILSDVREGERRDAVLYSARANQRHGVRLRPEDRERILSALITEYAPRCQADLIALSGFPQTTVSDILKRLNYRFGNEQTLNYRTDNSESARRREEEAPLSEERPIDLIEAALGDVAPDQREAIGKLLTAPLVPPDRALEAAQNVAALPQEQRERVAELAASDDEADKSAAVAIMRGTNYVDPAWPLVSVALEDLRKGLRIHQGRVLEGAFRTCIQHVEGLLEAIETEERRKTDVAA